MNPRELVDHIRNGPSELELDEPLRFRRRAISISFFKPYNLVRRYEQWSVGHS
jgi:hypothetical protein